MSMASDMREEIFQFAHVPVMESNCTKRNQSIITVHNESFYIFVTPKKGFNKVLQVCKSTFNFKVRHRKKISDTCLAATTHKSNQVG